MMELLRTSLKIAGGGFIALLLMLIIAFGLVQTKSGKAWLARELGDNLSSPGGQVTIADLAGLIPFDIRIGKIHIADAQGPRVVIDDAAVEIAPAELLVGRLSLRLSAHEIRVERLSESGNTDLGFWMHPPLSVTVTKLQVDELRLGPTVFGEPLDAALTASGGAAGGRIAADIDFHRIDGQVGQVKLHIALDGTPLRLEVAGDIAEPSGRLLAGILHRHEPLPFALRVIGDGPLADWHGQLAATAGSDATLDAAFRIIGDSDYRVTTEGAARITALLPPRLRALVGEHAGFSAAVRLGDHGITLDDMRVVVAAGILTATGHLDQTADAISGDATLQLPDLATLTPLFGSRIGGSATATLSLSGASTAPQARLTLTSDALSVDDTRAARTTATLDLHADGPLSAAVPIDITGSGQVRGLELGSAALPGRLGDTLDWRLAAQLDQTAGRLAVSELAFDDAGSTLAVRGSVDAGAMAGRAHLIVPDVARFIDAAKQGALVLDTDFRGGGDGAVTAVISGALREPASGVGMLDAILGREAKIAGTLRRTADGVVTVTEFSVTSAKARLAAEGTLSPDDALRLSRFHLEAAGTRLDGPLTIHVDKGTVDGTLVGTASDLKPWSASLGTPIAGSAQLKAILAGTHGQAIGLTLDGANLGWGTASAQKLRMTARLADLLGKPVGRVELQFGGAKLGNAAIDRVRLVGETTRPGRFALTGEARGTAGEPFTVDASANLSFDGGGADLRVVRLAGTLGNQPIALRQPLRISRRGSDMTVADLALGIGGGRLAGAGSIKGNALSLHLLAQGLSVRELAALGGQQGITGTLDLELTLSGTRAQPQGDLIMEGEQIHFAATSRPDLPPVGIVASAVWRGREVQFKGRLAAPRNAALGFTGGMPLVLDPRTLAPHLPADGALSLHLEGHGELADLSDLLPIGEDRLSGRFAVDVSMVGSVAAPAASGQISVRKGGYESLTAGTNLTDVNFDLVGDRDHLVLQNFTASDGAKGRLDAAGSVNLAAATGPAFDITGQLKNFRAAQRDEGTGTASGEVRLTGTIMAPQLAAALRIDSAELRVPERLSQSLRPISVTKINSATGQTLSAPSEVTSPPPWLAVTLDVTVDMPGQVFVRGRGLDSEWRGRLAIGGTTASPQLTGKLEVVRGTYDFIGKSFTLNSGTIAFLGGQRLDPQIAIEAQVSSTDVVAIVRVSGTATQPKIALSSQPELPQDQILARVLFGSDISQISASQGLEIAQAAASLATGGGPGVLDKIRSGLGLDRLTLGSANANSSLPGLGPGLGVPTLSTTPGVPGNSSSLGVGTSPLPTGGIGGAGTPTGTAGAAAVSAGKYVADGVYVGVTQGLSASTSSVDVQIDVTRHITIDTTAGGTGEGSGIGTGFGINWKLDY